MDIKEINELHRVKLPSSNRASNNKGFQEIIDKKMSEINAPTFQVGNEIKAAVVENSEKILNLLDTYANALTDPSKTLKDIEPLVESIEKGVRHIESEAIDKIPQGDELNGIIKDLTVTANVALFKFHRGDYV